MKRVKRWMGWMVAILFTLATPAMARATATTPGAAPAAARTLPVRVAAASEAPPQVTPATRDYAQREARSPQAADFRGGDGFGIYIGSGAALVIVVLLVILLVR